MQSHGVPFQDKKAWTDTLEKIEKVWPNLKSDLSIAESDSSSAVQQQ